MKLVLSLDLERVDPLRRFLLMGLLETNEKRMAEYVSKANAILKLKLEGKAVADVEDLEDVLMSLDKPVRLKPTQDEKIVIETIKDADRGILMEDCIVEGYPEDLVENIEDIEDYLLECMY